MDTNEKFQVFISYRREGGDFFTQLLHDRLREKGYNAFLDVESLREGKFNEALLKRIEECPYFICVLPPGGLDRCKNEDDWVRKEIAHAIRLKKKIIPIMLRGFEFPPELPSEIDEIRNYNAIKANDTDTFPYAMQKLVAFLGGEKAKDEPGTEHKETERLSKREKALKNQDTRVVIGLGTVLVLIFLMQEYCTPQDWLPDIINKYLEGLKQSSPLITILVMVVFFYVYKCGELNDLDYMRVRYADRLLTLDRLDQPLQKLLNYIIEVCPEEVSTEISAPEEAGSLFNQYRSFKHFDIGSVDGKRVDYLLIKGYNDFWTKLCVLCLSGYTFRSASNRILSKLGFIYVDGRDKDIARFQNGEFELDVLYGSFGLDIIGLELRRNIKEFSRLLPANQEKKDLTVEQTVRSLKEESREEWKQFAEVFKNDMKKEAQVKAQNQEKQETSENKEKDSSGE